MDDLSLAWIIRASLGTFVRFIPQFLVLGLLAFLAIGLWAVPVALLAAILGRPGTARIVGEWIGGTLLSPLYLLTVHRYLLLGSLSEAWRLRALFSSQGAKFFAAYWIMAAVFLGIPALYTTYIERHGSLATGLVLDAVMLALVMPLARCAFIFPALAERRNAPLQTGLRLGRRAWPRLSSLLGAIGVSTALLDETLAAIAGDRAVVTVLVKNLSNWIAPTLIAVVVCTVYRRLVADESRSSDGSREVGTASGAEPATESPG